MARRASHRPASRALEGVEITVDAEPAGRRQPDPPQTRRDTVQSSRRAFEGEVISRMRTQARRRPAPGGVAQRRADN
jgi:hypothetical protein